MDPDRDLDACYEHVMKLVDEVGDIISSRFFAPKAKVVTKSSNIDFVTETDQQVEKHLMDGITAKFPSHKFIGEEETSEGKAAELTDAPTWIIDPVDGTMNFVHGFPHSCVSIALLVDKVTEIGIVYNPVLNQKFTARRGKGAFLNGKEIHVSSVTSLADALICTETGTSRDEQKMVVVMENLNKLTRIANGIRCLGAAALNICMVALGGADCYFEFGLHAWDMAAGELIVREAGGVSLDPSGGALDLMSRRCLVAASQELANELIPQLTQYHPLPRD
ncbi:inositol monophosphatase 1 [Culicoides brevitarsis]|uniref:inositol monophosphatase 1 n=1 Tax=Culicoides brevitarsis TaxID=469753 RepID=UPI00307C2A19